uniref:Uncharacterized protein n=1 Tax=viral metagenome TaxID=1070528 RepID=A0A6M3K4F3_9ZZZZ
MTLSVGSGRKVVTTAGTAEVLESSAREVIGVIITAETDQTDYVVVGDSTVVEADTTRTGLPLYGGDSVTLYGVDLNKIYIDVATSGYGVTYLWWG